MFSSVRYVGKVRVDKLRYQYTPNDHNSFAPVYGRTFHANPTKVYIF